MGTRRRCHRQQTSPRWYHRQEDQPPSRARQTLQISIGFLEPSPQQRRGQESQQRQPRRKTSLEENSSPATKSSCCQSQESRRRIRCSNPIRIYHLNWFWFMF